jgi:hypothetical protein
MQSFEHSTLLPAPARIVIEQVTSEPYLLYRYKEPKQLDFSLDILRNDDGHHEVRIVRVYSTEQVPRMARKLLGQQLELIQTQHWSRSGPTFNGGMRMEVAGVPGFIEGQMSLTDHAAEQSRMQAQGNVKVKVPIIGGQIEKLLLDRAEEGFSKSMDSIAEWLQKV